METKAVQTLIDMILKPENISVMTACWVVMAAIKRAAPELSRAGWWARLQPVLPLFLCIAAMWIPGIEQESLGAGDRVILGIMLGGATGHAHKLFGQTFLRRDKRLKKQDELELPK